MFFNGKVHNLKRLQYISTILLNYNVYLLGMNLKASTLNIRLAGIDAPEVN